MPECIGKKPQGTKGHEGQAVPGGLRRAPGMQRHLMSPLLLRVQGRPRGARDVSAIGLPDTVAQLLCRHADLFRYPTIGLPDTVTFGLHDHTHQFRYPTIGLPDTVRRRFRDCRSSFRYPTIGLPDTVSDCVAPSLNKFRYPTIGLPDTVGMTQAPVFRGFFFRTSRFAREYPAVFVLSSNRKTRGSCRIACP